MASKDYYEILGVERNATEKDITRAYRKLAMKYHPDRNPDDNGAIEKFKEATEAYEVLSDSQKKNQYDQYGHVNGFDMGGGMRMDSAMDIFEHLFKNMGFGGPFGDIGGRAGNDFFSGFRTGGSSRSRRSGRIDGEDVRFDIEIDIFQAAAGYKKTIEVKTLGQCLDCEGTGLGAEGEMVICPDCGGTGEIKEVKRAGFAQIVNIQACPECKGAGETIEGECDKCNGRGRKPQKRKIAIDIPPGVSDSSSLLLKGKGNAGIKGGFNGDLYVMVNIPEHEFFKRRGDDILAELPITIGQALLGDTINVPTLHGEKKVKIKPGTEPDEIISLKNMGMPHLNRKGNGDMFIRIFFVMPDKLTRQQKKLAKQWWESEKKDRGAIHKVLKDKSE